MKDKNFWIGVIVAVLVVILYKCSSASIKTEQAQMEEETLTLSDLNYVSATSLKSLPNISFAVYKPAAEDQFEEKQVKLEDYKGKPVVLHFWATWCNPCQMELPKYDIFAKNQDVHNIAIVSENQTPETIAAFYKKRSINNLSIAIDSQMALTQSMHITGLPTTIFINKDGKEVGRVVGPIEWDNKRVVNLLLTQLH